MNKLKIILITVLLTTGLFAQNTNDYLEISRDVLKTEKKALIAEAMQFTESDDSAAFWALYNEYNDKMYAENTNLVNVIKDYAKNYDNMTDEKAKELWANSLKIEGELHKLKKTYFKKFLKIMPPTKVVRYFQAENKIKSMIDAKLALEIPLLEKMN